MVCILKAHGRFVRALRIVDEFSDCKSTYVENYFDAVVTSGFYTIKEFSILTELSIFRFLIPFDAGYFSVASEPKVACYV